MLIKEWKEKPDADEAFKKEFAQYNPVILRLLYNRGLKKQDDIDVFFNPDYGTLHDPFLFADMEKAVVRILKAIDDKEKIMIHGDYDADGVTSSSVVFNVLKLLGGDVHAFIPHREADGYGLNVKTMKRFVDDGVNLMITVDCGTTNVEEIKVAHAGGIDVIVTDHHSIPPVLPPAFAILNPHMPEEPYPFKGLSGVGMAYKLSTGLIQRFEGSDDRFDEWGGRDGLLKWILDVVAIGLVADIVPLLGENRTLVKYGLLVLSKTRRPGLLKLAEVANIDMDRADSYTIGFQIAPRINAAGRLKHGRQAFDLLTTDDDAEAERLAFDINEINAKRRSLTTTAVDEAREQVKSQRDNPMLFVFAEHWEPGIVGLISGRITEENYKPTFAMTRIKDSIVGSGRSVAGFNVTTALYAGEDYLTRFGGHPQACGFTIGKHQDLDKFTGKVLEYAKKEIDGKGIAPFVEVDGQLSLQDVTIDLVKILDQFQPFGEGNPKPQFAIHDLTISSIDTLGKTNAHLKLMVKGPEHPGVHKLLGFNLVKSWGPHLDAGDTIDVIVELSLNVWNGRESADMKIVDLRKKNAQN